MAKIKSDGHIHGLEFNRYVCFLFRGNQTIFDRVTANFIFDLQGQGYGQDQIRWSYLGPKVHSICLLFVSRQSNHHLARIKQIPYLTLKIQVQVHNEN